MAFFRRRKAKPADLPPRESNLKKLLAIFKPAKTSNATAKKRTELPPLSEPIKCFRVRVRVAFKAPVNTVMERDYECSPDFAATDDYWNHLMAHLKHHSSELITRHDSAALESKRTLGTERAKLRKLQRYSIYFLVDRNECRWTEQTFVSYQREPITVDQARMITSELHQIIGEFMILHDAGFVQRDQSPKNELVPSLTACVPEVVDESHNDAQPGYSIEMSLRSQTLKGSHNTPSMLSATSKIHSSQTAPLTVPLGQDLLKFLDAVVNAAVSGHERNMDGERQDHGLVSFDLLMKLRNSLGPQFQDLSLLIHKDELLFDHADVSDFDDFTERIKTHINMLRIRSDNKIKALPDFSLAITHLRGQGWEVPELLTVSLDPSVTYNRRVIDAILARIQATTQNALNGTGLSVTLTAHKRGHVILEETLNGLNTANGMYEHVLADVSTAKALQEEFQENLRSEISRVCKTTFSLDVPDIMPNFYAVTHDLTLTPLSRFSSFSESESLTPVNLASNTENKGHKLEQPSLPILDLLVSTPTPSTEVDAVAVKNTKSDGHATPALDWHPLFSASLPAITEEYGYLADQIDASDEDANRSARGKSTPEKTPELEESDRESPEPSESTTTPEPETHPLSVIRVKNDSNPELAEADHDGKTSSTKKNFSMETVFGPMVPESLFVGLASVKPEDTTEDATTPEAPMTLASKTIKEEEAEDHTAKETAEKAVDKTAETADIYAGGLFPSNAPSKGNTSTYENTPVDRLSAFSATAESNKDDRSKPANDVFTLATASSAPKFPSPADENSAEITLPSYDEVPEEMEDPKETYARLSKELFGPAVKEDSPANTRSDTISSTSSSNYEDSDEDDIVQETHEGIEDETLDVRTIVEESRLKSFDIYTSIIMHLRDQEDTGELKPNPSLAKGDVLVRDKNLWTKLQRPPMTPSQLGRALIPYIPYLVEPNDPLLDNWGSHEHSS